MTYSSYFTHLLTTSAIMFCIDLFYLLTFGIWFRFMVETIQQQPMNIRYLSAIAIYPFMAHMLLETKSYFQAFTYGVCIYAVFDLTNYSIFTDYDIRFAIADILWGGVLFVLARYLMLQPSNIK
jgi:uncharacterized membrane protein